MVKKYDQSKKCYQKTDDPDVTSNNNILILQFKRITYKFYINIG